MVFGEKPRADAAMDGGADVDGAALAKSRLRPAGRSRLDDLLEKIATAWANGDTAALAYLLISDLKAKAPDLYQKLLVDRNVRWAQKMETMLRDSGVQLVAVGAAHLAGPIAYKRNS